MTIKTTVIGKSMEARYMARLKQQSGDKSFIYAALKFGSSSPIFALPKEILSVESKHIANGFQ